MRTLKSRCGRRERASGQGVGNAEHWCRRRMRPLYDGL